MSISNSVPQPVYTTKDIHDVIDDVATQIGYASPYATDGMTGLSLNDNLIEIASQLKRIADILEKK